MSGRISLLASLMALPMLLVAFTNRQKDLPKGLRLPPEVTHATYMNYALSQEELDALTANFATLDSTLRIMRERADAHLLCHIPGRTQPRAFAVFLYEGLIFEGYDSESWLIQGQGGRAIVHKMNAETRQLLEEYAREANEQAERRRRGGRI
jgi:hypothetical protein